MSITSSVRYAIMTRVAPHKQHPDRGETSIKARSRGWGCGLHHEPGGQQRMKNAARCNGDTPVWDVVYLHLICTLSRAPFTSLITSPARDLTVSYRFAKGGRPSRCAYPFASLPRFLKTQRSSPPKSQSTALPRRSCYECYLR